MRKIRRVDFGWFFWGLGSQLQLIASLSFAEAFVFLAAPYWFSREWPHMKRNGLATFFMLSVCLVVGCAVSCVANHSPFHFAVRGLAATALFPCTIIVAHRMLRRKTNGYKWYFVGAVISIFVSTFAFRQANEVLLANAIGGSSTDAIMSGPLYWIRRLSPLVTLLPNGWYLQCPWLYSCLAPLFMAGFAMAASASGRSAALGALARVVLTFLGGKNRMSIRTRVCRPFWLILLIGFAGVVAVKGAYSYAAEHAWLGEAQIKKYERQTKEGTSVIRLLLAGRAESFGGLLACVDKPLIGFGPWAEDRGGYNLEFISRYGSPEDWQAYYLGEQLIVRNGGFNMIMAHSFITNFWLWFGIFGLVIWIYISFVLLRYLKQDCWAVPQWYFWLATAVPGYFWAICFSPFGGDRVGRVMFVVACLFVRAVRKGRQQLPYEMQMEILKSEGHRL